MAAHTPAWSSGQAPSVRRCGTCGEGRPQQQLRSACSTLTTLAAGLSPCTPQAATAAPTREAGRTAQHRATPGSRFDYVEPGCSCCASSLVLGMAHRAALAVSQARLAAAHVLRWGTSQRRAVGKPMLLHACCSGRYVGCTAVSPWAKQQRGTRTACRRRAATSPESPPSPWRQSQRRCAF